MSTFQLGQPKRAQSALFELEKKESVMVQKCLVTGVAGFIGSHLAERLLAEGYEIVGLDCFTDFYPRAIKEANLQSLRGRPGFRFIEDDLCTMDLASLLREMDYVLHEAAQAGVRSSWGSEFMAYVNNNIVATQRLLEASRGSNLRKFVFASSASVYSNAATLPTREDAPLRPYSPYGVTKLAAENLCHLYHDNLGLPTIVLRYFSVYGPRQRPDMALHRFIERMLQEKPLPLFGDGTQTRNFTYISDVVEATVLAMRSPVTGRTFNTGGGSRATINQVIALLEEIIGKRAIIDQQNKQHGDASHTWADTTAAEEVLGFKAHVGLREGLATEVNWLRQSLERRKAV